MPLQRPHYCNRIVCMVNASEISKIEMDHDDSMLGELRMDKEAILQKLESKYFFNQFSASRDNKIISK